MNDELIVVGGGVVGLASALAMSKLGYGVTVFDANALTPSEQKNLRVYAINQSSQQFLQDLNVWDEIARGGISAYEKMRVWDGMGSGVLNFDCCELAKPALGHIVEERVIKNALLKRLNECQRVRLLANASLQDLHVSTDSTRLHADERSYACRLLLAADGGNSWARQQLRIETVERSYHQRAIVCELSTTKPHQKTAYQCYGVDGPLALLPLSGAHDCSVVWSVPDQLAENLMALSDKAFSLKMEAVFGSCLGKLSLCSKRISFPLFERQANTYVKTSVALLGDAAHSIHPMAGLGANLGLSDVESLAHHIKTRGRIDYLTLRAYERERKTANTFLIKAMSSLDKIFGSTGLPPFLRGLGMRAVAQMPGIKKALMAHAINA